MDITFQDYWPDFDEDGPTGHFVIGLRGERVLACTCGDVTDTEALARVYSTAHQLLAALEVTYKWWTETSSFDDGEDDMPAEIFDGIRSAIAKARGRQ